MYEMKWLQTHKSQNLSPAVQRFLQLSAKLESNAMCLHKNGNEVVTRFLYLTYRP